MTEPDFDAAWLSEAAKALGVAVPDGACVEAVLAVAAHAAHDSGDRRNAPVLAFLVGLSLDPGDEGPLADSVRARLAAVESRRSA